jgi:hypothetical protein
MKSNKNCSLEGNFFCWYALFLVSLIHIRYFSNFFAYSKTISRKVFWVLISASRMESIYEKKLCQKCCATVPLTLSNPRSYHSILKLRKKKFHVLNLQKKHVIKLPVSLEHPIPPYPLPPPPPPPTVQK